MVAVVSGVWRGRANRVQVVGPKLVLGLVVGRVLVRRSSGGIGIGLSVANCICVWAGELRPVAGVRLRARRHSFGSSRPLPVQVSPVMLARLEIGLVVDGCGLLLLLLVVVALVAGQSIRLVDGVRARETDRLPVSLLVANRLVSL